VRSVTKYVAALILAALSSCGHETDRNLVLAAGPVFIGEDSYSFGRVLAGEFLSCQFDLETSREITITEIKTGCDCSSAVLALAGTPADAVYEWGTEIPAGTRLRVSGQWKPKSAGVQSQKFFVIEDSGPGTTLVAEADVVPAIAFTPGRVDFGKVVLGGSYSESLVITSDALEGFALSVGELPNGVSVDLRAEPRTGTVLPEEWEASIQLEPISSEVRRRLLRIPFLVTEFEGSNVDLMDGTLPFELPFLVDAEYVEQVHAEPAYLAFGAYKRGASVGFTKEEPVWGSSWSLREWQASLYTFCPVRWLAIRLAT